MSLTGSRWAPYRPQLLGVVPVRTPETKYSQAIRRSWPETVNRQTRLVRSEDLAGWRHRGIRLNPSPRQQHACIRNAVWKGSGTI